MRSKIVAGNWKMNLSFSEADDLVNEIVEKLDMDSLGDEVCVVICPPFPYLELVTDSLSDTCIQCGAQNVSGFDNGAYTGEVSASMLDSMGVEYCIVGHSERRKYFGETNQIILEKIQKLSASEFNIILCVGEDLQERESGKYFDVVRKQLEETIFHLSDIDASTVIIAYEPVWAIGTGVTATSEQAQEMHAFIRSLVKERFGEKRADLLSILYGGSCNAKNAKELFSNPDIDGGLIGGASLKADDFVEIVKAL
ncbi:MAG: triosephosphate isomerase [Bacteroidetes bacterium]|nr:triosephosphate isomerase [Bacteroidota bacterium]